MLADLKIILLQATRNALLLTPMKSGHRVSFGIPQNFELPANMRASEIYSDIPLFARFVRGCVDKANFGTKKVVFCLEDDQVISKEYQHLPCKSKNLLSFAKLEADSVLSDDIDDYIIQNYEYGLKNEVTGKMTSSLFVVKNKLISEITKNFSRCGLHVIKVTPPVSGLLYAAKAAIDSKGKTVAVLDLSFEKTRLLVLHEGFPVFQRTFEPIYDDIIEILMKSKSISYQEAVALISSYGAYGTSSADPSSEAFGQITALLDACANEAVRNIRMVISSERLELNRMVLCGAMSTLPNSSDFWNQLDLDIPLEPIELCAATGNLPQIEAKARRAGYQPAAFFTASGLLPTKKAEDIDFLKTVKIESNQRAAHSTILALITVAALGIMLLEPLLYFMKSSQNTLDKASLAKYTEVQSLMKSQSDLTAKLAKLKGDRGELPYGKSGTTDVTKQLFEQVAAKVKSLDSFSIDTSSGSIALIFKTASYTDYLSVKESIESNAYFTVSIPFSVTLDESGICTCSVTLKWKDFVPFGAGKDGGKK